MTYIQKDQIWRLSNKNIDKKSVSIKNGCQTTTFPSTPQLLSFVHSGVKILVAKTFGFLLFKRRGLCWSLWKSKGWQWLGQVYSLFHNFQLRWGSLLIRSFSIRLIFWRKQWCSNLFIAFIFSFHNFQVFELQNYYISAAIFFTDPVYRLQSPGKLLDSIEVWQENLEKLGGANTAYWPNQPIEIPRNVRRCLSIILNANFSNLSYC